MKLSQKFSALFRGRVQDSARTVIDDNLVTIIRQEVRDAEEALQQSRQQLNALMVERKQLEREMDAVSRRIHKKEAEALALHGEGNTELVEEVAEFIAREELHREELNEGDEALAAQEAKLTTFLQESARKLADYRRQLRIIEARQSSQARQLPTAHQGMQLASSLGNLKESLDRASEKQRVHQDAINADQTIENLLDNNGLQQRIELQLGSEVSQRTEAVMKRLALAP